MNLTYKKIQKILDLIDDRVAALDSKVNNSKARFTPIGEETTDYYVEEKNEAEFLKQIKDDFLMEINKVSFVFSLQTGMDKPQETKTFTLSSEVAKQ